MRRRFGVVLKLWLAFVGLVLVALTPSFFTLNPMLEAFYHQQVEDPLVYHARRLAEMMGRDRQALAVAPLMGEMAGAEVYVTDAAGRPLAFPGAAQGPPPAGVVEQVLAGREFVGHGSGPGGRVLVAAVPVPGPGAPAGVVALMAAAAPLEQALAAARRVLVLAVVGAALLAGGIAVLLARALVSPLVRMEQVARAMARGDFATRVAVAGEDEVGRLGAAINALAGDLQRYEQSRREFLANVAHELRTPLAYVQGYSQALADGVVSAEADRARYLQVIHEEAVRLGRLVEDLMDLAAMDEGGALTLNRAALDLAEPVSQAVAILRQRADQKGVEVETDLPGGLPPVHADGQRIQQVLLNLLDNALRHTPAGGTVRVVARVEAGLIRVEVQDTGPGIPPAELEAIWDRFHKVERSRAGGGRGLGLAIVRSIVRAHGGEVGAESRSGRGSTLWFSLPVAP